MKLQWVRLANGFHYAPAIFVQVGRHSSSGPVVVRTPLQRDENFEDGWLWSDVVDSERQTDAYFNNIPDAKTWVESHLPLLRPQTNWDYDGKPKLAPRKLTPAQLDMLRSVATHGYPEAHINGMAAHGGATLTRRLLEHDLQLIHYGPLTTRTYEHGVTVQESGWTLTDAGRVALETNWA